MPSRTNVHSSVSSNSNAAITAFCSPFLTLVRNPAPSETRSGKGRRIRPCKPALPRTGRGRGSGAQQKDGRQQRAKVRLTARALFGLLAFAARGWGRSLPFKPALTRRALLGQKLVVGYALTLEFWRTFARRGRLRLHAVLAGLALLSERIQLPVPHGPVFWTVKITHISSSPGGPWLLGIRLAEHVKLSAHDKAGQGLVYQRNSDCAPERP